MESGDMNDDSYKRLKALEASFHRDLMSNCRKYLNHIGIVSVLGIIDLVKQEIVELEHATRRNVTAPEEQQQETSEEVFQ
jgi:hypothetical protein